MISIYDFYWLYSGFSYKQFYEEDERVAKFYLQEIQNLYIKLFLELFTEQLEKYVRLARVDVAFDVSKLRTLPERERIYQIQSMMRQTYRTDMRRRNERWDLIIAHLIELMNTGLTDEICKHIDRINNAVHNTETQVLDKLPNGEALLAAFDAAHRARTPKDYAAHVSPEVRRLMKHWTGPGR